MKNQNGQSLFEVVIAIAIGVIVVVAIVGLVTNSIRNSTFSRNESLAADYAQKTIEWLRGERDTNISLFLAKIDPALGGSANYCFKDASLSWAHSTPCNGETIEGTVFIREGLFEIRQDAGKTVIEAEITVSWTDSQGDHKVVNTTNFTDWRQR